MSRKGQVKQIIDEAANFIRIAIPGPSIRRSLLVIQNEARIQKYLFL